MALKPEGEEICPEVDGPVRGPAALQAPFDGEEVNLNPATLEEALRSIRVLHERLLCSSSGSSNSNNKTNNNKTAQQLLLWRRRAVAYEEALSKLSRASQEQLQMVSGQLMLFKARLVRKQKDIGRMLAQREAVIQRQHRALHLMQARMQEAGLDMAHGDLDSPTGETNLDSLNDSDSAVIMEDGPGSDGEYSAIPRFRHCSEGGAVTVVRSVSDAVEAPSAKWRQQQFSQPQRGNTFLRRPEVLETVYSVEEDGEGDGGAAGAGGASGAAEAASQQAQRGTSPTNQEAPEPLSRRTSQSSKADSVSSIDDSPSSCPSRPCSVQYGSLESGFCSPPLQVAPGAGGPNHVTTYNRVMSNHRSVTKPKDVKYKRINKAKSKSLEELRGRLRNWVDKGITSSKFISLDQSYA